MKYKSRYSSQSKILISILFGILSVIFVKFGFEATLGEINVNIPWSLIFPLIIAIVYGSKYGIIAGVSGGVYFPFLLWPSNGAPNFVTALVYLFVYFMLGLILNRNHFKFFKSFYIRATIIYAICLIVFTFYYQYLFRFILSLNPSLGFENKITEIPREITNIFMIKDSINFILLSLVSFTLVELSWIRKILGLTILPSTKSNNTIFLYAILISIIFWVILYGLGFSLLYEKDAFTNHQLTLIFFVVLMSSLIVAKVLFKYNERKYNAEKEIREREEKLRKIIATSPDGLAITDLEGNAEYLSPKCLKMWGYEKPEEVIGRNTMEFIHPAYHQRAAENMVEMLKGHFSGPEVYLMVKKDGSTFYSEANANLLLDSNDQPFGILYFERDITERIKIEGELLKAKDQAEESDRLKSAFLANMSHEIRTPMNGILGFADLLKEPNLSGEEHDMYLEIIERSGNRMLNIINDIISISKIEAGLMNLIYEESNINDQIDYIYTFFKPEVDKKGIQFSYKHGLPSKDATIKIDREKLYAILTNLVKNAIKYCDDGFIEFGYEKKGNFVEFYVKDSGIGIPVERQEAIFERFIQADIADKMARQGAGLGLSISKAYIEMMGGKIWVESAIDKGSTFYFTLPYPE